MIFERNQSFKMRFNHNGLRNYHQPPQPSLNYDFHLSVWITLKTYVVQLAKVNTTPFAKEHPPLVLLLKHRP
jgi:hypothetical protein